MKHLRSLLTTLVLVIALCLSLCLFACDCNSGKTELATPTVTVGDDGVASWEAIENASGYAYRISGGEELTTELTSVTLTDGQSIEVKALGDGKNYSDSPFSEAKTYVKTTNPVTLGKPVVTIDGEGVASWTAVENASGYKYSVDGGTNWSNLITSTSASLEKGQTIIVKAIGDGERYLDGAASDPKTYPADPVQLGAPTVEIDDETGEVTITADSRATKVIYAIGDGEAADYDAEHKPVLENGQKITVTVKGDGQAYTDSEPVERTCALLAQSTYAQYASAEKGTKVWVTGVVTAFRGKNVFLMDTDGGYYAFGAKSVPENLAVGMTIKVIGKKDVYNGLDEITGGKIVITNETPSTVVPVDLTSAISAASGANDAALLAKQNIYVSVTGAAVEVDDSNINLTVGTNKIAYYVGGTSQTVTAEQQTAIKAAFTAASGRTATVVGIVALHSGKIQLVPAGESVLSNISLTTPVVSVDDNGVASWTADEKASGYKYSLDGGTTWADATANSVTLTDGQTVTVKAVGSAPYALESAASTPVSYTKTPLATPVLNATTTGVSWAAVEHAAGYEYRIDGGEWQSATGTAIDGLDDGVKVEVVAKAPASGKYKDGAVAVIESLTKLTTVATPTLAVAIDGTASWTCTEQDVTFLYTLGDPATATDWAEPESVKLTDNQTLSVKATKNSLESEVASVTYKAPQNTCAAPANLTVAMGVNGKVTLSWSVSEHAVSYDYVIGDGNPVAVTSEAVEGKITVAEVTLADGQTVKVRAIGDTSAVANGDYSARYLTGAYCSAVTFAIAKGTSDSPLSVSEVLPAVAFFGETASTGNHFFVTGEVTKSDYYPSSSTYTVVIKDAANETKTLTLYAVAINSDLGDFTFKNALVGATVKAQGQLKVFTNTSNVSTNQLVDGQIIYIELDAQTRINRAKENLLLTKTSYSENFVLPSTTYCGVTISSWTVETGKEAIVAVSGYNATVTLPATATQVTLTATLAYGSASVTDNTKDITITVLDKYTIPTAEKTLAFDDVSKRTAFSTTSQVWEFDGIKFTNDKAGSSSNVQDYKNPIRLYKNSTVKIEYTGMAKLIFNCGEASYASALNSSISNVIHYTNGSVVTVDFVEPVNSFEITPQAATRLLSIAVVYYSETPTEIQKETAALNALTAPETYQSDATKLDINGKFGVTFEWSKELKSGDGTLEIGADGTVTATASATDSVFTLTATIKTPFTCNDSEHKHLRTFEITIPKTVVVTGGLTFSFTANTGSDSSTAYTAGANGTGTKAFLAACENETNKDCFMEVTAVTKVYKGKEQSIKFGGSKAAGSITLKFTHKIKSVTINLAQYDADCVLSVDACTTTTATAEADKKDFLFTLDAATDTITISTDNKRCYVYSITVTFE